MSKWLYPKNLKYALKDGIFFSMMTGFGESYLSAYAIFLMATNFQVGLLASLPQLIGSVFQIISVKVLNLIKNRKKVIIYSVLFQSLIWLPILSISLLFKENSLYVLIILITIYFIVGNFSAPAWNSLMGDIVDSERRGRYFGNRSRLMSVFSFISLCIGGIILHYASNYNQTIVGFMIIFFMALISRLISGYFVSRMEEPEYIVNEENDFSIWSFLKNSRGTNFARFILYTSIMHFAVHLAAPYISVYLLRDLKFSYFQFMIINAVMVISQFLTLNYWGKIGDKFGNKKVLMMAGYMAPIIPLLWMFHPYFYYILIIQFIAGVIWAGFSLSMGNFVFDLATPPKRAKCVAIFNLFNTIGILLGASAGSLISYLSPTDFYMFNVHISMRSNLIILFLLSGIIRLVASLTLLSKFSEVRDVQQISIKDLIYNTYRSSILYPVKGMIRW